VKYLVDTNAWIAFFEDAPILTKKAATLIEAEDNRCFVSVASIWEAAIKINLGKLQLPYDLRHDLPRILADNGFELIGLELADVVAATDLARVHGDPFDRIQVIQARRRGLRLISRDPVFDRYGLKREWD
jgi:PIN domain nuclease of toxin-antitoxin system